MMSDLKAQSRFHKAVAQSRFVEGDIVMRSRGLKRLVD